MKNLLLFVGLSAFVALVLFATNTSSVFGLWIPRSNQDLLEQSQTIFVGNIITVKPITLEKSLTHGIEENEIPKTITENYTLNVDQYGIDMEEFLKNPQTFEMSRRRLRSVRPCFSQILRFDT